MPHFMEGRVGTRACLQLLSEAGCSGRCWSCDPVCIPCPPGQSGAGSNWAKGPLQEAQAGGPVLDVVPEGSGTATACRASS